MRSPSNRLSVQFLILLVFALLASLGIVGTAFAQNTASERPRIGLALSGGAARAAAHLGVLQILEREYIPVDYIAGTSMGSIIGGMYASGLSPEEIEAQLVAVDWDDVFDDKIDRENRSFRRKSDDRLWLINRKPGFSGRKTAIL